MMNQKIKIIILRNKTFAVLWNGKTNLYWNLKVILIGSIYSRWRKPSNSGVFVNNMKEGFQEKIGSQLRQKVWGF